MYSPALPAGRAEPGQEAGFRDNGLQFDDLPNLTECAAMQPAELSLRSLRAALLGTPTPNRLLTNLTFLLQREAARFLPRLVDDEPPRRDYLAWQLRLGNLLLHGAAGLAAFLLLRELLALAAIRPPEAGTGRPASGLLPLALTLLWFCSPLQVQAVAYVIQRSTVLATLLLLLSLLAWLRWRRGGGAGWLAAGLAGVGAVLSKEIAIILPGAALLIELLLLRPSGSAKRIALAGLLVLCAAAAVGPACWYGRDAAETRGLPPQGEGVLGILLSDRPLSDKIRLTPVERLLTQARVVALYESLLLAPLPSRLSLERDLPESRSLRPGPGDSWRGLGAVLLLGLALARRRAFLPILALLTLASLANSPLLPALTAVWREPWPVPALLWHLFLFLAALALARRQPLVSFGLLFFFLGQLLESTVLPLEMVFEHRLYLPSLGFLTAAGLGLHEALGGRADA